MCERWQKTTTRKMIKHLSFLNTTKIRLPWDLQTFLTEDKKPLARSFIATIIFPVEPTSKQNLWQPLWWEAAGIITLSHLLQMENKTPDIHIETKQRPPILSSLFFFYLILDTQRNNLKSQILAAKKLYSKNIKTNWSLFHVNNKKISSGCEAEFLKVLFF